MEVVRIANGRLPARGRIRLENWQGSGLLYFLLYGPKSTAAKQRQTHCSPIRNGGAAVGAGPRMLSRRLLPLQFGVVLQWLILWVPVEKLLPKTEQGATDCRWSRSKSRPSAAKTRVYGCLPAQATTIKGDAAQAARDKITLTIHDAAIRLYDLLADRLQQYAALCDDSNAEARGEPRTKIELTLPPDGWLGKLLSRTLAKIITVDDVASLFPLQ
jgi:hypothetical protein